VKTYKELLLWTESGYGGNVAIADLDADLRWTYAELNDRGREVAAALAEAGIGKGDRIAWLAMSHSTDLGALVAGAKKLGAVLVVMNGRASVERIAWMINRVGVSLLAYAPDTVELLERVRAQGIPEVATYLAFGEPVQPGDLSMSRIYEQYRGAPEPDVEVLPGDTSHITYTSGSSGPPKPIFYCEENWLEGQRNMAYAYSLFPEDTFLNYFPPHFTAWFGVNSTAVMAAATQVVMRFDPPRVVRALVDEGCTHLITTPSMVRMFRGVYQQDPESFAGNRVRAGMLGGEPITPDVMEAVATMFPSLQLMGSLGSTESGGAIMHTGLGNERVRHDDGRLVGKPMIGMTVELRDPDTGAVITGPDQAGELFVRGPIASGVWGDDALTAKNFPDGWWRSGDLLVRDADGYYSFAGRGDSVFKSGAIKVSTDETEAVLKAHPQILDAVVVPVPDPQFGMVGFAFVRHQGELDADALDIWWRGRDDADPVARPRHWSLIGEEPFPMVTAAKVDRHGLRQRAVQLSSAD
jgi:acyl-coenzyme A synthetase/AMP-(fatty) acid ligase